MKRHVSQKRRLAKLARITGALLLLDLITGCGPATEDLDYPVVIHDDANLLSEDVEERLREQVYPRGFAFVIVSTTVESVTAIGVTAGEAFETLADSGADGDAIAERGVVFVVTEEPRLVQVRVGSDLASLARWKGLTVGPEYLRHQRVTQLTLEGGLRELVGAMASRLPAAVELPWYRRWLLFDLQSELLMDLEDLGTPSDSFYGHVLLRPLTAMRFLEQEWLGTWWFGYCTVGFVGVRLAN
ncbi:hypothetical protein LBMAG42_57680 [Deltaproteobacteria bacterium]|nr:hypothetical protein LBMAG42_57680 [Deltaproteobacteria bacterium]